MAGCWQWTDKLIRKKVFTEEELDSSELRRCLRTRDLIGLGVSSTLGAGVYILSGQVARESAGPAVVLSFFIAGLVASLSGLCYAEFSARVPRAGSAYVYSYITVGELMAFVIGWNVLLEYVIGAAGVARALSAYVDYMTGNNMQRLFHRHMPIAITGLAAYPDFFAFSLVLLATVIVALGVKESAMVQNALSCVNVVIISLIIVCGLTQADLHNWRLSKDEIPASGAGNGGFTPFGFSGVVAGAATCFFAFVGFDFISSMGEEAENSRWSVPVGMGATLTINMLCYCGVAAVVTLMAPYYLLDTKAPVAFVFDRYGWPSYAMYAISLGAVCGMGSSIMAGLFPMARVVYAMSSDGLIFRSLSTISPRFRTPLLGTLVSGGLAALMALLFDVNELIDMMSIGTLLAFGLVAVCVLILRYEKDGISTEKTHSPQTETVELPTRSFKLIHLVRPCSATPTEASARIAHISIAVMCVSVVAFSAVLRLGGEELARVSVGMVVIATVLGAVILTAVFITCRQPQNPRPLKFKVPLVPVLPAASCMANVYLMFKLSVTTWLRLVVWLLVGFCIYFFYGLRHSTLNAAAAGAAEEYTVLFSAEAPKNYTACATESPPPRHKPRHTPSLSPCPNHSATPTERPGQFGRRTELADDLGDRSTANGTPCSGGRPTSSLGSRKDSHDYSSDGDHYSSTVLK